jgi:hypothetical protein
VDATHSIEQVQQEIWQQVAMLLRDA